LWDDKNNNEEFTVSIEQNNFNNLVTQIEAIHQILQAKAIKSVSSSLTLRNWLIGYYIVEYEQSGGIG